MGNTIPNGSRIRIRWRDGGNYQTGQIVACVDHGFLFAHRIVHVRKDVIITQGDGGILCDPPFRNLQVVGEVSACRVGGEWQLPANEAVRFASDALAAGLQVRLIAMCLRVNLSFARLVAMQMIKLNVLRKRCRQWLAVFRG